ncbi:MAG: hypothetical protein WC897_00695 [Candidatus Gracilibacteria bacterium]
MDPTTPIATNSGAGQGATQDGAQGSVNPADPQATGGDYDVPQVVLDKYPELVELIKKTESMSREEREYWFQILPIMTDDQVSRLKTILEEEASQLSKLDTEYQDELAKLNQKHLEEWNTMQKKQEREKLQEAEATNEADEAKKEADILGQLDAGANSDASGSAPTNP